MLDARDGKRLLLAGAIALSLVVLPGGCGGKGSDPNAVVRVGDTSITRASIDHWARALAGQAFVIHGGIPAPRGVLVDLANDARCATDAASVAGSVKPLVKPAHPKPPPTAAQLRAQCRELYKSARREATEYLISVQGALLEADKYGMKVSPADVQKYLVQWQRAESMGPGGLHKYLAERGWTLADELYEAKRSVLWIKLTQHIRRLVGSAGVDGKAYADLLRGNARQVITQTHCHAAYMVQGCRGYRPGRRGLSLAVAVEDLVSG
jgi:hypothetical protein